MSEVERLLELLDLKDRYIGELQDALREILKLTEKEDGTSALRAVRAEACEALLEYPKC